MPARPGDRVTVAPHPAAAVIVAVAVLLAIAVITVALITETIRLRRARHDLRRRHEALQERSNGHRPVEWAWPVTPARAGDES